MNRYMMEGVGLTILGGILWGFSGMCSQFLQQFRHVRAEWLVPIRLLLAGVITLGLAYSQKGKDIFNVWRCKRDVLDLVIFAVFGIGLCQYSYFKSIYYAGAGIATVLQYLGPSFIIIYVSLRYVKWPRWIEMLSVILATLGIVCIALQGQWDASQMQSTIVFWGLISAVAVAIYSYQPNRILRTYGTMPIVGFAMVIGGLVGCGIFDLNNTESVWDLWTWLAFFSLVFLGAVVSFNAYHEGVQRIGAVRGSILSSVEPISAALLGWTILDNHFTSYDIIGFILIIITIFMLAFDANRHTESD